MDNVALHCMLCCPIWQMRNMLPHIYIYVHICMQLHRVTLHDGVSDMIRTTSRMPYHLKFHYPPSYELVPLKPV